MDGWISSADLSYIVNRYGELIQHPISEIPDEKLREAMLQGVFLSPSLWSDHTHFEFYNKKKILKKAVIQKNTHTQTVIAR